MDGSFYRRKCSKNMRADKEILSTETLWTSSLWTRLCQVGVCNCICFWVLAWSVKSVASSCPLQIQCRWFFYLSETWVLINMHQSSCSVTLPPLLQKESVPTEGQRVGLHVFSRHPLETHFECWVPNKCSSVTLLTASSLHLCQGWTGTKISRENMDHGITTSFLPNTSFKIVKSYEHMTENNIWCHL